MGSNNLRRQQTNIYRISVIGLMAALVLAGSYIQFKIPTPLGPTRFHFGNVFCLLSGLLFGGPIGGLASGIGSAIFDLFDPHYAAEFWITFIMKFAMGFIAGVIAHSGGKRGRVKSRNVIAAVSGSVSYVILYFSKTVIMQRFLYQVEWPVVLTVAFTKAGVSLINGIIAVVVALILGFAVRPALQKAGIIDRVLVDKMPYVKPEVKEHE